MHDLVVRDLEQARNRTLGLTGLADPTLVTQHDLQISRRPQGITSSPWPVAW